MKIHSHLATFAALVSLNIPISGTAAKIDYAGSLRTAPEPLPVKVSTSFHLVNLSFVNERTETFDADVYIDLQWHDPRLAFTPRGKADSGHVYIEQAAEEKLKEIWWPEVEFVNTATPQITNRSLIIRQDGTVRYLLGLTSTFRSQLNLRRFPFDEQTLEIRLQSFLWETKTMVFVADSRKCGRSGSDTLDDLKVSRVGSFVRTSPILESHELYSEFVATITAKRAYNFYLWRVFFPAILIMFLSCSVYFIDIDDLYSRVNISLTCLLACIASQFAISFNLPRISYLTPIDKLYMITYGCIAISVGVSILECCFHRRGHRMLNTFNKLAAWLVPIIYALLLISTVFS